MLLLRLWNYIRGYVIIVVEGYFLEKFINICIRRQIFLWDVKKQKNSKMTLKISIAGFKLLRPVASKTGCRVRIVRKRGLPFLLNRYKRRKTFALGAIIFVLLIYVLTSFIWSVDVTGNKKLDTSVINEKLASMGIKPGILKYWVDTDKIANDMMLQIKELAWIGVAVKGTKIRVDIVERIQPPELIPKEIPCDIVAAKDGVIKELVAKAGQEMVKTGDTVKKGQVLISGSVPIKNETTKTKQVHALGSVHARTWYEAEAAVNTKVFDKVQTGRAKDKYSLVLFSREISILSGKVPYENYDKIEMRKRLSIGEDFVFPFEILINRYSELSYFEREIGLDEAKQAAADEACKEAAKNIPDTAEVLKTNVQFKKNDDGSMIADAIIECLEDIGVTEAIGGK